MSSVISPKKKIEAIIKEEHLDGIKEALKAQGFIGMTIMPVKGRGQGGGIELQWRAGAYQVDFLHKVLVMLVVPEDKCQQVVDIIIDECHRHGDHSGGAGKIFISTVDEVIRIRTRERE